MRLSELHTGERGIVVRHHSDKAFRKRLLEMGFIPGEEILVVKNAPLLDPVEYRILGYDLTLRRQEAESIEVLPVETDEPNVRNSSGQSSYQVMFDDDQTFLPSFTPRHSDQKKIRVAFVGNPNSGKTSLFNVASGANEHVGNYSGVTVETKSAFFEYGRYKFEVIDLPGTYSLSSYSPEEKFVLDYLLDDQTRPDIVLNVVDSSSLERHLYMTTQLIEGSIPMVVALNMYDELEHSGSQLDIAALSKLLGVPMVPTVGRTGRGLNDLLSAIISVYEKRSDVRRMIDVHYNENIEQTIEFVRSEVAKTEEVTESADEFHLRPRFLAIKLLEEDPATIEYLRLCNPKRAEFLITRARYALKEFEKTPGVEFQQEVTNGRFGFVHGALLETYKADYSKITEKNRKIDHIMTHRIWGLPIFVGIMFLVFQLTFSLGQYPMDWIEMGVVWLGDFVGKMMSDGPLRDLIVDGVIAGVGGVLGFLPNIVILYLCIALMEDTGYLARAAFIMDRLMHMIGLHGKSFIPLLMGFGCNVPAIMATRTIENRNARIITMLITPFMSCSARLPIYLLLAGAFFPKSAGLVLFGLYFGGILIAIISAIVFRQFLFASKDTPFVMELPPYRIPTAISVLLHMWQRAKQYLQKMGTTILVASIAIWALGYFPRLSDRTDPETEKIYQHFIESQNEDELNYFMSLSEDQQMTLVQNEHSYIGRLGHVVQLFFAPMGYDWRMSVSLVTGMAAKEVVVSTLGVLYVGDAENEVALSEKLTTASYPNGESIFNPVIALSFMAFVLIYFPCIATFVAVGKESGSWKLAIFLAIYSTALAWWVAWLVFLVVSLFI